LVDTSYPIAVHEGDDLHLVAKTFAQEHRLDDDALKGLAQYLSARFPQSQTSEWRHRRVDRLAARWPVPLPPSRDALHVKEPLSAKKKACSVTVAMTTCKRLHLFNRTVAALRVALADVEDLICGWLVVDDGSSNEDQIAMMTAHPDFTFIFKAKGQIKGHASSMNIVMDMVRSPYCLYFEDDWEVTGRHQQGGGEWLKDALAILHHHRAALYSTLGVPPLTSLGRSGTDSHLEPVVEVLLNDQGGGWPITIPQVDHYASGHMEYRVHEFGTAQMDHPFTYWPGFSLNPGLWDIEALRTLGARFNTSDRHFEQKFSLNLHDNGLRMAFLPMETAAHIGDPLAGEVSAYILNDLPRWWDAGQPARWSVTPGG
jgi:hypothetical protein